MLVNLNYKNPSVDHEKDLQRHTASLMEEKNGVNGRVSSGSAMVGGPDRGAQYSQTASLGTVKVERDFFELDDEEFNQIKNSALPEFASFTLDGKECYHCGEEFNSTSAMHQHPKFCTRMKNATHLGKVVRGNGTFEPINNVKIPEVKDRAELTLVDSAKFILVL